MILIKTLGSKSGELLKWLLLSIRATHSSFGKCDDENFFNHRAWVMFVLKIIVSEHLCSVKKNGNEDDSIENPPYEGAYITSLKSRWNSSNAVQRKVDGSNPMDRQRSLFRQDVFF